MDDIEEVLSAIRTLYERADRAATALYEADPENNGRLAQRWSDIAMMLEQTLDLDAGDDASEIDVDDDPFPDFQSTPETVQKVKDLLSKTANDNKPDPWSNRY